MNSFFKFALSSSSLLSFLFVNNFAIADTSNDVQSILNRLNQLEDEITSLKKQLKEKTEFVENNKLDQKSNFYISSGLGFIANDPYMLDADRPNDDNKSVSGHFNKSQLDGIWSADIALGYKFNKNIRG